MSWENNRKRVQFYNEELGKLEKTKRSKVEKFLEHRCIEKVSDGNYLCKPIEGYNKTPHHLTLIPFRGEYQCSCQGFRTYHTCSHVDTLNIFLKINGIKTEASLFPTLATINENH